MNTRIAGLGRGVPDQTLTNYDLERMVDTSDAWITERTGIKQRHIAAAEQVSSDIAAEAARSALNAAGVRPDELDAIVVATVTPDLPMPATAVYVQQKIGAKTHCPAFDISAACAGFLFGLGVGDGLIGRGTYRRVLVIGVDLLSRVVDWTDRNTCVLFGDGAGAAVLVPCEDDKRGVLAVQMHTDGAHAKDLVIPRAGSSIPDNGEVAAQGNPSFVRMNGRHVFTQAVRNMSAASMSVLERFGYGPQDITTVFAHQANLRILEGVCQRTKVPWDRFYNNIERYGNTSSASIPIAMSEAFEQGRIIDGDLLLLTALGAGVSWASALVRW